MKDKQKVITISLPAYVEEELNKIVQSRQRSKLITHLVQDFINDVKYLQISKEGVDHIEDLFSSEGREKRSKEKVLNIINKIQDE